MHPHDGQRLRATSRRHSTMPVTTDQNPLKRSLMLPTILQPAKPLHVVPRELALPAANFDAHRGITVEIPTDDRLKAAPCE